MSGDDPEIGELLALLEAEPPGERWQIREPIDKGGLGIILLGVDRKTHGEVAIKFLRPRFCGDERYRSAFTREARQADLISTCDNTVTVLDFDLSRKLPYIVFQYIKGVSLDRLIPKELAQLRCLEIALRILTALAGAHKRGVTHGDLKPRNVLIAAQGEVKVIDFGFALSGRAGLGKEFAITPQYAAPEVIGGGAPSVQSDIFSFGVLLHELLTGGESPWRVARVGAAEAQEAFSIAESIEEPTRSVLERCLQRDPSRRWASVVELQSALHDQGLPPAIGVLIRERFRGRCLVCGLGKAEFDWAPAARLCGQPGCRASESLSGGKATDDRSLLVSILPEWRQEIDWEHLPSIFSSRTPDLFARFAGQRAGTGKLTTDGFEQGYLPYQRDFLAEVCGARCGNPLVYRLNRVAYSLQMEERVWVLDFAACRWSSTLKDPRSWAIVNVAIERGVQHLASWTAGNAGLSLARLCQMANHWLPEARRLRTCALHGPVSALDDRIRLRLMQEGSAVIQTAV